VLFRKLPKKEQNKIIRKEEREFKLQNQRQLERGICMYYGCSSRASFIDIGKKVTTGVCVKCNALSLVPAGLDKESYASGFVSGWFWDVEGPLPKNVYLPTSGKDDRYSLSCEEGFNNARSLRDTPLEDGNVWAFTDEVDDASKPQIQVPRPWKARRVY